MNLETFFEKFDLFAGAPGAVAKMRELVLDLAVKGKLTDRDLKKESVDSKYSDEPSSNILPANWHLLNFGKFCDIQGGNQPPKSQFSDEPRPGYVRMFQIRDLGERPVPVYISKESTNRFCREGEILIGRYGASVGKVFWAQDGAYNVALAKFIFPEDALIPPFAFWLLKSDFFQAEIAGASRSAQAGFNKGDLAAIDFPIPPLAEQRRIVAKVDELMALCDRLEAQQLEREAQAGQLARASLTRFADAPTPANLNLMFNSSFCIHPSDLRKSILTLAVQGKLVPQDPDDETAEELLARLARELTPERCRKQASPLASLPADSLQYDLPDSWTWARFRDAAIIASNLVKPDDFLDFTHLAPDNIEKGNGVLLPCRTVREDKVISSNHRFYPGQIVYSKIRPNLAKVVVVDFEGLCSADMYPIDALINVFYLQLYMLSESFLVQAVKTDTRVAMPKINQSELNAIAVPIPPLAEQRRIVAKVSELMASVDELETQLAASRAAAEKLLSALVAELTVTTSRLPTDS